MSDQCVPRSEAAVEESTGLNGCSIILKKSDKQYNKDSGIEGSAPCKMKTRKRRNYEECQRTDCSRVPDVKVAHKKAKRRSIVKDKKREIHRQNERYRHHSVNTAIKELSQLVPCLEPRQNDTKQNIVQRTGEYMEYLNNKVTIMCDQLRCRKRSCHDSLVFNHTLSAVFDGHEETFPAVSPINLSSLEDLLDNMCLGDRTYNLMTLAQTRGGNYLMSDEEDGGESFNKVRSKEKTGGTQEDDTDIPRGQPFISPAFQDGQSFTSPSLSGSATLRSQDVVTPGYLGDGEDSVSPHGTISSNKSLYLSHSSDDSNDGWIAEIPQSSLLVQKCTTSTQLDISKKVSLLRDEQVSRQSQQQRVCYLVDTQQLTPSRSFQVAANGPSPVAGTGTTAVLPQFLLIPRTMTKLLHVIPSRNKSQGFKVTEPAANKTIHGKENQPESMANLIQLKEGVDETSPSHAKGSSGQSSNRNHGTMDTFAQHLGSDGYNLFFKINHPHFQQAWPHLDGSNVTNLVSQAWNDLPEEVRTIYSEKASDCNLTEPPKQDK